MGEPFRFLHCGQLHLEEPVGGLTEIPKQLRQALIDAPLQSARKVFETALDEEVDFVVIAGDLLQPHQAGPHAISFLLDQFERLQKQDIPIYWVGGVSDAPEHWPDSVPLPPGVHHFSANRVEELSHFRGENPIATIVGRSYHNRRQIVCSEYRSAVEGSPTIAVAYGTAPQDALDTPSVAYWALGGQAKRTTVVSSPRTTAHYCGAVQGRDATQSGPHGCTVVSLDEQARATTRPISCDAVRWRDEALSLPEDAQLEQLQARIQDRVQQLAADAGGRPTLIRWRVQCDGALGSRLRGEEFNQELLQWARRRFGSGSPPVWTSEVQSQTPHSLPESWYDEDTIRGDFLRAVRMRAGGERQLLDLKSLLSPRQLAGPLAAAADLNRVASPEEILKEAAALGADVLAGGD